MYWLTFPYVLGVFLAWITWYPARYLEGASQQSFFRVIMAVVALGFIGFPLQHREWAAVGFEFAVLVVLLSLILLSRLPGLIFLLPIAWFSHVAPVSRFASNWPCQPSTEWDRHRNGAVDRSAQDPKSTRCAKPGSHSEITDSVCAVLVRQCLNRRSAEKYARE